jgi:GTP-dependent phosphoenolpyruvate carboxykinase
VGQFFETFGTRIPDELAKEHETLRQRLLATNR